jgi:hypothetical protein
VIVERIHCISGGRIKCEEYTGIDEVGEKTLTVVAHRDIIV